MNIDSIKVHDVRTLTVLHPTTNEKTDIELEIFGSASKHYRKTLSALNKANNKSCITIEEREKNVLFQYASLINGWKNIQEPDSKGNLVDIVYSVDKAVELFEKQYWLFVQVLSFVNKEANFLEVLEAN